MLEFKSVILDLLDVYSDIMLALKMYKISRDDFRSEGGHETGHYNICFVWICLSIFCPMLLQYATINSWMF